MRKSALLLVVFSILLCMPAGLILAAPAQQTKPAVTRTASPPADMDPIDLALLAPMVKRDTRSIGTILRLRECEPTLQDPWILVEKSAFKLSLFDGETLVKEYPVSFGFNPVGDKVAEGDGRTPEGDYYITQKSGVPSSKQKALGTRWMRLSYPNINHAERGLKSKLISSWQFERILEALDQGKTPLQTTRLGGGIGIHGGSFDYDGMMVRIWTLGCVGLYNSDVEDLYRYIPVGTPVKIRR